jgi:MFS superfamily sulfate permease-like transporter
LGAERTVIWGTPAKLNLFASFRGYRAAWLTGDLNAGMMLAAIAIPEQLATAKLAGFPVEAGLYAFAAGTIAFAVLGTSRFVSVGADSTTAPIFAASLGALAAFGGAAYHGLAAALALCVGAILIVVGFGRAGWIADLLSIPVTMGILAGISVHIIVGQLPSLLGIADPSGPLLLRLVDIAMHLDRTNPFACALGLSVLGVTILGARADKRIPGALAGLAGAGIAVAAFDLRARGVSVLGELRAALPPLRLAPLQDVSQLVAIAPLALIVAAVCTLQTSVVVRSFPSDPDIADDVSSDFVAIGLGSILAGFSGAFPVNSSPPRTEAVQGAGGRSQFSGLIAVAAVAAIVALSSRFFAYVPQAALAGVLVFIGLRIFHLRDIMNVARYSRREINLVIAGALLVIVFPIQTGMLLAIMLSLAHGVVLVMWPASTQLLKVRDSTVWWPPTDDRDLVDVPGIVVFAPAAPVNFTNAEYIRERLLTLVAQARQPVKLLVIEASGMTDVDYTGSQTLQKTIVELRRRGINVGLARLIVPHAQEAAKRSGLIAALGQDHVFPSVQEAIVALSGPSRA